MRIWLNRTYATNVHTIAMLRDNPDGTPVTVIGTHADPDSPVLAACDITEMEPDASVTGDEYVAWALDFCARHHVDVLIPRLHLDTIAAARDRFAAAGVAVVAGPCGPAALFEDKAAAYADAAAAGIPVPPHRVVRTAGALLDAYDDLLALAGPVCVKPVSGVGGAGFRILTDDEHTLADLLTHPGPVTNVDAYARAVELAENTTGVPPLLVMPVLPGPEVSVDCLADFDGTMLCAVPRTKVGRRRLLTDDPAAVQIAESIVSRHKLYSLSNTQVRYWAQPGVDDGPRPYLLETNARISGGLFQTQLAGVNLPWAAVLQALGTPGRIPVPVLGRAFTTVSHLVPLGLPA